MCPQPRKQSDINPQPSILEHNIKQPHSNGAEVTDAVVSLHKLQ